MPIRLSIYPYNLSSQSAKALADTLGIKRVRVAGKYRWRPGHRIINWGNSKIANWMSPVAVTNVWNKPVSVALASRKYETLVKLHASGVSVPDFTTDVLVVLRWFINGPKYPGLKHAVLCRTLTRADSGRGIVLATKPEEVVPAPLYTRYVPKTDEYRVHLFREFGIIDVQQKKRSSEVAEEDRSKYIRNHDGGWVFCREDVSAPQVVLQAAIDSIFALGLDFGAVDIGFHPTIGACVYEVNTAPGLEGQTLINYATRFKQLYVQL